VLHKTDV